MLYVAGAIKLDFWGESVRIFIGERSFSLDG
jgi:hypothetical protein